MHIASVRADSLTAGLSPKDNKRTEVFFAGCKVAREGHPCDECFNQVLWNTEGWAQVTVGELFDDIVAADNKYVTLVGGEPVDQYEELVRLINLLTANGYHVVLITHYTMRELKKTYPKVLEHTDVIIDGPYNKDFRIFDSCKIPGIHHVIGSSNQKIWYHKGIEWLQSDKSPENLKKLYYGEV